MNRRKTITQRTCRIAAVSAVWLLTAPTARAVEEHHPDQKPATAAPAAPAGDTEQTLQQMQRNTDKLRAQMDKMLKTKDPAERRKLMQEYMQTLRASMATAAGAMGGAGGGMMMGGMMDCPMMGGMMNEAMTGRLNQMEKRLDMMQLMLEDMRKK